MYINSHFISPLCLVVSSLSCPTLVTPWTVDHQTPVSMVSSRQEHWSRLPLPSPGDLLDPGIEPVSFALADRFFTTEPPGKPLRLLFQLLKLGAETYSSGST